jgi:hypothetical protein
MLERRDYKRLELADLFGGVLLAWEERLRVEIREVQALLSDKLKVRG